MPNLDTRKLSMESGLGTGAAILGLGGAKSDIAIEWEVESQAILFTLVSDEPIRNKGDGSSVSIPGHSNMMPLAIGNGNISWELKEDRGHLSFKEIDVHTGVNGLQDDTLINRVIFRAVKGEKTCFRYFLLNKISHVMHALIHTQQHRE